MIYTVALIGAIIFLIFILNLVRKNKLDEKYSILWIFFGFIILIVCFFPSIIEKVALRLGVYYPPSLLFLLGIIVVGVYIVHITIVITKQNKTIVRLTQELGILKEKFEKKSDE